MTGHMLIQNASLVLPDRGNKGLLRVTNGSIATIAPGGVRTGKWRVHYRCYGIASTPGVIDPHVHFGEPGQPEKEDLRSGVVLLLPVV